MELVEGPTLEELISVGGSEGPPPRTREKGIPLVQALPIAKQIAEALEAAHEQGIIHRDLKPANIKVRADGTVKVLDFGLAKAIEGTGPAKAGHYVRAGDDGRGVRLQPDLSASPTITSPAQMTGVGVILGTAAYMAPEQAKGRPVDKRADIWAFGAVLFEVLTGHRAFAGEDVSDTLANVLKTDPAWERLPADVPARIRQVLRSCLQKDPRQRLGDMQSVRLALDGAFETAAPQGTPPATTDAPRGRLAWMAATAAMTVVAGVALWGWLTPASSEPRLLTQFTTAAPEGVGTSPIAVSRDGTHLAFTNAALNKIYIRAIDDPVATPVPGTEGGTFPAFSPDGQSLAFIAGSAAPYQLKKVPIAGGASLTLVGDIALAAPMTWGDDGNILLSGPELRRVSEAGGTPMAIAKVDAAAGEMFFAAPQLLPGGKYILADIVTTKGLSAFRAVAVDVATGKMTTLLDGVGVNFFAPTGVEPGVGHLVYGLNGSLFAAAFNAVTLHVGPVAPVLEGTRNVGGLTPIGFSRSGTLAYPGRDSVVYGSPTTLMWVDRQGTEQPLTAPSRVYASPRISPDGGRVARRPA